MTPERLAMCTPHLNKLMAHDEERYLRLMETAPDMTLDLARLLMRVAFPEKDRVFVFIAPVYLFQAAELTTNYERRQEVLKAINKIQEL